MSLQDWLAEPFRGPVGELHVGQRLREDPSRGEALAYGATAVALLALVYAAIFAGRGGGQGEHIAAFAVVAGIYLALGYTVHPDPDVSNLGWLGGLVNDPIHYTDNVNRQLLTLLVVLLPGRFLAESLVDMVGLVWTRKPPDATEPPSTMVEDAGWGPDKVGGYGVGSYMGSEDDSGRSEGGMTGDGRPVADAGVPETERPLAPIRWETSPLDEREGSNR